MKLPLTRDNSVVVQEFENETLIYDFKINKAYCLNETSTVVYRHCDGQTHFEKLKRQYNYTDDLIYLALDELQKHNLIESEKITHFAGMNRRDVIKKAGLGTLAALPIISALAAPVAAQAASNCVANNQTCIFDNYRQSNCCSGSRCSNPNSTCQDCLGSGTAYLLPPENSTVDACNASPLRNGCCNTTSSATYDGSFCLCP